ncbi:MAG: hypothetical protein IJ809_00685 [Clostridia bacterium]|nr:hypothetical protein [Clostridia bacterium]
MTKHYVLSIVASIILVSAIVLVMFLIMLPQVTSLSADVVPSYARVRSDEYEFVETKELVTEILAQNYSIGGEDITTYTNNKQYVPGNYDPFTPTETVTTTTNNSTNQTANQNTTASNTTSTKTGAVISGTTK